MSRTGQHRPPATYAGDPGVLPIRKRVLPVADPSEQAFAEFWTDNYPRVRQLICHRGADPVTADEIASAIFCTIWERHFRGGDPADLKAMEYLALSMVRGAMVDHARFLSKARQRFDGYYDRARIAARSWMDPEHVLSAKSLDEAIDEALAELPERTALAFRLASDDWSYERIAAALNMGRSAVGDHLTRARRAVRAQLERRGFSPRPDDGRKP